MTTAKPTKGPWIVSGLLSDNVTVHTMGIPSNIDPACKLQIADCFDRDSQLSWEEMNSNAKLIAEAGTVYHETSLTPRQLDDQRRELFEAIKGIEKDAQEMVDDAAADVQEGGVFRADRWLAVLSVLTKAKGEI